MKRTLIVLSMLLVCFSILAVEASEITRKMDWSSEEAALVQAAFKDQSAVGLFRQTKALSSSPRKFVSTGTVQILPGTGMVWYTEKPYASTLVVGKDVLSQSVRGGDFVHLEIANNQIYVSIAQCMDAMFSGDFTTMQKSFEVYCLVKDGSWNLRLIPQDKAVSSFIEYIVMSGESCLESLLLVEKTGDSVLYELSDLTYRELTADEVEVYSY